jgi:hypothetical protein
MPSFAAMIAKVTVEGDTCLHQGFPGFVNSAAEGDELFFCGDPDSSSKLFVRRVEPGSGFGVVLFQTVALRADHGKRWIALLPNCFNRTSNDGPSASVSYAQSKRDTTCPEERGVSHAQMIECRTATT